jgi:hypothetical protein
MRLTGSLPLVMASSRNRYSPYEGLRDHLPCGGSRRFDLFPDFFVHQQVGGTGLPVEGCLQVGE